VASLTRALGVPARKPEAENMPAGVVGDDL